MLLVTIGRYWKYYKFVRIKFSLTKAKIAGITEKIIESEVTNIKSRLRGKSELGDHQARYGARNSH